MSRRICICKCKSFILFAFWGATSVVRTRTNDKRSCTMAAKKKAKKVVKKKATKKKAAKKTKK